MDEEVGQEGQGVGEGKEEEGEGEGEVDGVWDIEDDDDG